MSDELSLKIASHVFPDPFEIRRVEPRMAVNKENIVPAIFIQRLRNGKGHSIRRTVFNNSDNLLVHANILPFPFQKS